MKILVMRLSVLADCCCVVVAVLRKVVAVCVDTTLRVSVECVCVWCGDADMRREKLVRST